MAKQRFINTRFWSDGYIDRLDPSEKLMFLYLLTNERTTISGAYELPSKIMAVETGFDKSMVDKILSRFVSDGKILHEDGWIVVINAHKHQNLANPKIRSGVNRELSILPLRIKKLLENSISNNNLSITNQDLSHLDSDLDSDLYSEERSKEISEQSSQLVISENKDIATVIDAFKVVNPAYSKWFANTTQRSACARLIKAHGLEKVLSFITFIEKTNGKPYAPTIATPLQLEDKLPSLKAWAERKTAPSREIIRV